MADIFDIVLKTSLYAAAVGLVILIFKGILKNRLNAKWHYLIWFILILKLLIPFGPQSSVSLFNVLPQMPEHMLTQPADYIEAEPQEKVIAQNPVHVEPLIKQELQASKPVLRSENLLPWLWFSGALLILFWILFTYFLLLKKLRKSSLAVDDRILEIFNNCKSKMGIKRGISVKLQEVVPSPCLIGIIHPTILISPVILDLSDKEIEYIMLHEMAHYKRKDYFINCLLLALQIIHWFNPVIWYCFRSIREDMELAADERVLSILDNSEHKDYGRALLTVLESYSASRLVPRMLGMADDKKNMERRLKMIKRAGFFKSKPRLLLVLGILGLIVLAAVLLTNGLSKPSSPNSSDTYNAASLYEYKTAYVGDNSKVINLLNNLPYAELRKEVSLQTEAAPYGITVDYDFTDIDIDIQVKETLLNNTVLLFSLIDNVDSITYKLIRGSQEDKYQYLRAEVQKSFADDLRKYAQDSDSLESLIDNLGFKLLVYPSQYTPAMSSTPGIRIQAQYSGSVEKVRYSTENGGLFIWDENISQGLKIKELPCNYPVYWSPFDQNESVETDSVVTASLLDEKGQVIDEKQLNIHYDGSFYTVKPSIDIVIGSLTSSQAKKPRSIDEAVSLAILSRSDSCKDGEVATEGHIILDTEEKDGQVKAYIIASNGNFGFENGMFTKVSGSGAIPAVISFLKNKAGGYSMLEYQQPRDGADYTDSIKKMFPVRLWIKVFDAQDRYEELSKQEEVYAEKYLISIGRKAEVSAKHVEKELADINVQASNKLTAELTKYDVFLNDCPYWLGTREQVEDGIRYIYKKAQSKTSDGYDLIIFSKSTEDGTVVIERKYKILGSEPQLLEP